MHLKSLLTSLSLASLIPLNVYALEANASSPTLTQTTAATMPGCVPGKPETSNNYMATKWYRDSVERNAQYHQVFSIGLEKVTHKVAQEKLKNKNWGVIMDIDETVLDNSHYQKDNVLSCTNTTMPTLYANMEQAISTATPGAHNFTRPGHDWYRVHAGIRDTASEY